MCVFQMFSHISGAHVNSAVTIAALIMGKIDIITFQFYIVAQCLGALVGYGLLWALLGITAESPQILYCHTTIFMVTEVQALFIEFIATMLLCLAVSGLWDENNDNRGDSIPIKIGLILTGLIIATANYTGASFNTFRSLAPAVFYNEWEHHWIYWVGPNLGGALGALIYRFLLQSK
ncbi:PREDICTED: aquaporin AQPAe.a-like [Nicrophorus vespilloides]|uniref:Aquaporin AQPAe.a-like n=1 Tax=Nicrophorus vespilloides TaxID=110193 RepID=A0ABM1M7U5_NICVS|nr:PREDICTED: aquaporin AQPAe.a-like [Nicrophorus vespilloides]